MRTLAASLVASAVLAGLAVPQDQKPPSAAQIKGWIEQLGDEDLDTRKAATKKLETAGESALIALREAAKKHKDADVRLRAAVVARAIHQKLFGEIRQFTGLKGWLLRVVITPDGKHVVCSGDTISIWELDTGKKVRTFSTGGWGLDLSRDGKKILCSTADRSIRLYDFDTGKELQRFTGHRGEVWAAALSPDGKHAFTGGFDRVIRVWETATGKEVRSFSTPDYPRCSAISPDGKHLAVGHFPGTLNSAGVVRIWDWQNSKQVAAGTGHTQAITAVAWSRDGKALASASFDGTVRLWDPATGKERKKLTGHSGAEGVTFALDGKRVVSAGIDADPTIRVWDVATGKEVCRFDGHTGGPLGVAVTPDGKKVLSCAKDSTLRLWPMPK
jgi:WD40 repeat protein